jgi:hypothetical protein
MKQSKETIRGRIRKRRVQSGLIDYGYALTITIIEPTCVRSWQA